MVAFADSFTTFDRVAEGIVDATAGISDASLVGAAASARDMRTGTASAAPSAWATDSPDDPNARCPSTAATTHPHTAPILSSFMAFPLPGLFAMNRSKESATGIFQEYWDLGAKFLRNDQDP
ncbi:MAG: hypothetical protein U0169_07830 [Polyangiaceae bacterium]